MKPAGALASAVHGFFGLVVRLNPFSRLDTYLLRHAPIAWRTQFFLVSSYALLVFFLLRELGRTAESRTIADVPTEATLSFWGWLTLVVTLTLLVPWVYRNFQTQLERARPRDVILLFGAYCLCFYSLSLVPTAYKSGTLRSLASFPVEHSVIEGDLARLTDLVDHGVALADLPDEPYSIFDSQSALRFYTHNRLKLVRPTFEQLRTVFSHYGSRICINDAPLRAARRNARTSMLACEPNEIANVLRATDDYSDQSPLNGQISIEFGTLAGAPAATIGDLRSKLRLISLAQRPGPVLASQWHRPLSIGRISWVLALALLATGLSCRSLLAPRGRLAFSRLRPNRAGRPSPRAARLLERYRTAPSKSIALRYIWWPHLFPGFAWFFAAFAFVQSIYFAAIYIPGLAEFFYSLSTPMLVENLFIVPAWAGCLFLILRGIRLIWRTYSLYTIDDLLGFGLAYYRPLILVMLWTAIASAAFYELTWWQNWHLSPAVEQVAIGLGVSAYGAAGVFILSIQLIWLVKMLASPHAARILSAPVIRWAAALGYLVLLYTAVFALVYAETMLLQRAVVQAFRMESLSSDAYPLSHLRGPVIAIAVGLLCLFAGINRALAMSPVTRSALAIEKFVFSFSILGQIVTVMWVWAFLNQEILWHGPLLRPLGAAALLFVAICWFVITARLTIRPLFRRWARAMLEPANA